MRLMITCPGCTARLPVGVLERGRDFTCGCGVNLSLPLARKKSADLEIAVFVRNEPPCPLCNEALEEIAGVVARSRVRTMTRVHPIDSSPLLQLSFQNDIPVVFVGGVYRFRGQVDPTLLRRLLETPPEKESS